MNACPCGSTPTLTERQHGHIHIMQLVCRCGNHGATLMYTKPEDRARMQQAAWDGWAMCESVGSFLPNPAPNEQLARVAPMK